jgi:hypothetical protein
MKSPIPGTVNAVIKKEAFQPYNGLSDTRKRHLLVSNRSIGEIWEFDGCTLQEALDSKGWKGDLIQYTDIGPARSEKLKARDFADTELERNLVMGLYTSETPEQKARREADNDKHSDASL